MEEKDHSDSSGGEATVQDVRLGMNDNIVQYIDDPKGRLDPEELGQMEPGEAMLQVQEVAEEAFDVSWKENPHKTDLQEAVRQAQEFYGDQ